MRFRWSEGRVVAANSFADPENKHLHKLGVVLRAGSVAANLFADPENKHPHELGVVLRAGSVTANLFADPENKHLHKLGVVPCAGSVTANLFADRAKPANKFAATDTCATSAYGLQNELIFTPKITQPFGHEAIH